jgi:hypothetical protein
MKLTPNELLELKLLVERLEIESGDRARKGRIGHQLTDTARDALRVLPVLKKLISMVGETHKNVNTGPYPKPDWSTDL